MDTISIREKTPEVPASDTLECAGCGHSFRKQELITVHEDQHDGLHFFNGDFVCRPCARANGVAY